MKRIRERGEPTMWRRRSLVLLFGALAACGDASGGSGEEDDPGLPTLPCGGTCTDEERCFFTECVSNPVPCDPSMVSCQSQPPTCPSRQTPSIVEGCWSTCVDVNQCDLFYTCTVCEAQGLLCLQYFSRQADAQPDSWCLERPSEITCTEQTCECLGSLCGHWPCLEVQGDEILCGVR